MNSEKKEVKLKFVEDKDVLFTMNLRSKDLGKSDKRRSQWSKCVEKLVCAEDCENENAGSTDTESHRSTVSQIIHAEKRTESKPLTLHSVSKVKSGTPNRRKSVRSKSIQEDREDEDGTDIQATDSHPSFVSQPLHTEMRSKNKRLKDEPVFQVETETPKERRSTRSKSIQEDYEGTKVDDSESAACTVPKIPQSEARRKSQRLADQSQTNTKISYYEPQDSLEESPVKKTRKSVILENRMPEMRRSSRFSLVAPRKSTLSPVRETSPSPRLKNKTKNAKTPEIAGRTKQKTDDVTPVRDPISLCRTPKSSKLVSRQSNRSSVVPRQIFSTPKSKGEKSPVNVTPKSAGKSKRIPKTPTTVRRRLGYELRARMQRTEFENNSMSDEESVEYESSSSSSDESELIELDMGRKTCRVKFPSPIRDVDAEMKTVTTSGTKHRFDYNFSLNADDYFISKSSSMPTSNNKLSMIETPQLEEEEIKTILTTSYTKHKLQMDSLILQYENNFTKWLFYLKEGFNLLMYGLGSKIDLLKHFHRRMLHHYHVVTIHGYCPGITIKNILGSLLTNILKQEKYPNETNEALLLVNNLTRSKEVRIFIVIHNIDGTVLRGNKYQQIFCKLASFPYIHLIASIDHINAPLLWGNSKMSQFNFVWLHVTTYKPYISETSFEDALHLTESNSEYVSLSSLREIFRPLVQKVKKIFQIIAKDRLENKNNKSYKGISMTDWYRKARSAFLVNNKTTFRVMLTELVDHKIIKLHNEECIPLRIKLNDLEVFYEQEFGDEN